MNADTSHIRACQDVLHKHLGTCPVCLRDRPPTYCETGKNLLDEYIQSFYANRDLEQVTATEANNDSSH